MTVAACAAMGLVLLGCAAYALSVLPGHRPGTGQLACLHHALAIRSLIVTTLLLIAAVHILRAARHPVRHARYLTARAFRRIPGLPDDGEPLEPGDMRDFIIICRGWKHATPERTRHP